MPSSQAGVVIQRNSLATLGVVCSWFVLNIAMGSSTKWLYLHGVICRSGECINYKFPLTITLLHMVFSWTTCYFYLKFIRGATPQLSFDKQCRSIAPLAVVFALSVAMGNLSLKYIYPSFNQMLGSMGPLITVLLAIVIEGKRYNSWTWISMPILCGGLAICSLKEVNFDLLGGFFATGATVLRAAKSVMQGSILSSKEDKLDAVALLYYMAPWAAAVLAVMALLVEGPSPVMLLARGIFVGGTQPPSTGVGHVMFLLVLSGLNACFLNIFNFLVTFYTNAVWQQVLGNVKSCLSIATSVYIFGNDLKLEQAIGVASCLIGVWFFNRFGGAVKPLSASADSRKN